MRQRTAVMSFCLLFVIAAAAPVFGQMELTITDETVLAGDPVTVSALVTNDQPLNGFSFGVRHDGAVLTATAVSQGPALLATNGGAGAAFFNTDTAPANGPGVVVAAVFSLSAPLDTLPVGTNHDAVAIDYSTSAAAPAGSSTTLTPASDLGSPPAAIVYSVAGVTFVPTTINGSVTFDVPAPTNVTCTLLDNCACDFNITWSNSAAYNTVEIRVGGALVFTLPGGVTSTALSLPGFGSETVDVRGVASGVSSPDASCTADCPVVVPAGLPSNLTCSIASSDPVLGCDVDVSWMQNGTYTSFDISVDGALVASLPGGATTTTVSLPVSATPAQICVLGYDECGDPLAMAVCCDVTCLPGTTFVRGDCSADGMQDIGDAITSLGILFPPVGGGSPALCDDACDNNDDGLFDISDPIYQLAELFSGGPPPPAPNSCGLDPTNDALDCASFPPC